MLISLFINRSARASKSQDGHHLSVTVQEYVFRLQQEAGRMVAATFFGVLRLTTRSLAVVRCGRRKMTGKFFATKAVRVVFTFLGAAKL
jgi:hypothetical protein